MVDLVKCDNCKNSGWVCEEHANVAWEDGDGCCGGAGMPCPVCNTTEPPRMPEGMTTIWSIYSNGETVQ